MRTDLVQWVFRRLASYFVTSQGLLWKRRLRSTRSCCNFYSMHNCWWSAGSNNLQSNTNLARRWSRLCDVTEAYVCDVTHFARLEMLQTVHLNEMFLNNSSVWQVPLICLLLQIHPEWNMPSMTIVRPWRPAHLLPVSSQPWTKKRKWWIPVVAKLAFVVVRCLLITFSFVTIRNLHPTLANQC